MQRFLLFTLYAPLQSWGSIALGRERPSWRFPSRSAVLGLVGAACGLKRDSDELASDRELLQLAVRADHSSMEASVDYHTAQAPTSKNNKRWLTRQAELGEQDLNTILSNREYLQDACFTAVLWQRDGESRRLEDIASAFHAPAFLLYLGRKGCPLGLPLNPELCDADSAKDALALREPPRAFLNRILLKSGAPTTIQSDASAASGLSGATDRELYRRDIPLQGPLWVFNEREVWEGTCIIP